MLRVLVVIISVCIITGMLPPASVAATGTDVAHTPPSGFTTTASLGGYNCNSQAPTNGQNGTLIDADDATGRSCEQDDLYTESQNGFYVQFGAGSGQTEFDLMSFRLLWGVCYYVYASSNVGCNSGTGAGTITHLYIYCDDNDGGDPRSDPLVYDSGAVSWAGGTVGGLEIPQTDLTTPCHIESPGSVRLHFYYTASNAAGGQAITVMSVEAYTDSVTLPAEFTEYVAGLKITHPPFERRISWDWIKDFAGSWQLTDSDDTIIDSEAGPAGASAGTSELEVISCPVVCGHDVYTIEVCEIAHECVTYSIDSDLDFDHDGYLIPPVTGVVFTYVAGCLNVTTDQCAAPLNNSAGVATFQFRYACAVVGYNCEAGSVFIGAWEPGSYCEFVDDTPEIEVTDTYSGAAWFANAPAWPSTATDVLIEFVGPTGIQSCRNFPLDVGGGVATVIKADPPKPRDDSCSTSPLGCTVQDTLTRLLTCPEVDGIEKCDDLWTGAVTGLHDAAKKKLPFAYVVLVSDGLNDALDDASVQVSNSDDCAGITLPVPLYYGTSPSNPSPTTWPITVMSCQQLEPAMGTDWYQALRTMMDPALWILYAWSQVKALQPKTSLNG